jgi:hypothetical protein
VSSVASCLCLFFVTVRHALNGHVSITPKFEVASDKMDAAGEWFSDLGRGSGSLLEVGSRSCSLLSHGAR